MKSCSAAEMPGRHLVPQMWENMFVWYRPQQKSHFPGKNENCGRKMIIPMNQESYCSHDKSQNDRNMVHVALSSYHLFWTRTMEWNLSHDNETYTSILSVWTCVSAERQQRARNSALTKEKGKKEESVSQETMQYSSERTKQMQFFFFTHHPHQPHWHTYTSHRKHSWTLLHYIVCCCLNLKKQMWNSPSSSLASYLAAWLRWHQWLLPPLPPGQWAGRLLEWRRLVVHKRPIGDLELPPVADPPLLISSLELWTVGRHEGGPHREEAL